MRQDKTQLKAQIRVGKEDNAGKKKRENPFIPPSYYNLRCEEGKPSFDASFQDQRFHCFWWKHLHNIETMSLWSTDLLLY